MRVGVSVDAVRPPSTRRVVKQRRAASLGDGVEAVAAGLEGDGFGERADGGARGRGPGERAEDVAGGDGVDDDVAVAADGEAQAVLALICGGDEAEVDLPRVLEGDAAARSERAARDEDLGGAASFVRSQTSLVAGSTKTASQS